MARDKKFDFDSLMPQKAASIFKAEPTPAPEPKAEIRPAPTRPVINPTTSIVSGNAPGSSTNNSLFMKPKKSTLKPASFTVYQEDLQEFKRINDELGYKDSEVIRILMRKYIDANRG